MGRMLSVSKWLLLAAFCFSSPLTEGQRISTVEIEGRSYYISAQSPYNAPLSWFLAYQYCRTIGMELLTEDSQEDAQVLRTFLNNNGYGRQSFWTSGNQLGSSQWLWMTSGQPYNTSFTYWAPAAKLTSSNEQCMLLDAEQWQTASCAQPHHFICQTTRCYFFNYVRSNPPSTNDTQANSRTRKFIRQGVRNISRPSSSTTTPRSRHHTTGPANRVIHFPDSSAPTTQRSRVSTDVIRKTLLKLSTIDPQVRKDIPDSNSSEAGGQTRIIENSFKEFLGATDQSNTSIPNPSHTQDKNLTSLHIIGVDTNDEDTKPTQHLQRDHVDEQLFSNDSIKEINSQLDLDKLLERTDESNTIADPGIPFLSLLLQAPQETNAGNINTTIALSNNGLIITEELTSPEGLTIPEFTPKRNLSQDRVNQLERKEAFSWALLPDHS